MEEHDEYIWLRDRVNAFEMAWPICASLVFHVLLILILTTTSTYYPAVGPVAQFDIFWVTPAAMPPDIAAAGALPAEPPGSQQGVVSSEPPPKVGIAAISASPPVFPDVGKVRLAAAEGPEEAAEADEPVVSMVSEKTVPAPEKPRAVPKRALHGEPSEEPVKERKVPSPQKEPVRKPSAIIPAKARQSDAQPDSKAAEKAEAQRLADLQDERRRIAQEKEDRLGVMVLNDQQAPRPAEEPHPATGPDRLAEKRQDDQAAQQELSEKAARENAERERISKRQAQEQEERNRQKTQQAVPDKVAREKAESKQRISDQARLSREQEEAKRQAERRTRLEKAQREKTERESAARARIAAEKVERERRAATLAERKPEQTRLAALQQPAARPQANPGPEGGAHQRHKEAAPAQKPSAPSAGRVETAENGPTSIGRKPAEPAAEKVVKPSEKPRQERGFVIASLHGDLKLVITGDDSIKLNVRFRDYAKSRRSKVLTRAEARREQTITPVLARTRPDTREAVIETAREGIYIFSAEPGQAKGTKATFTLKVFESGTRERVAPLGTRTISGATVLLKILMPEAILWNDESAFTGYLEDSESETKFNATTGLYWKEFHD